MHVAHAMMLASRSAVVLAAALAALSVAACSSPDVSEQGGEHLDESSSALTANDKLAFDYFLGKGLTPVQAAGIVGNLDQESNMDPNAVEPGGPGRGIAQWSVGGRWNSDAGDNAVAYAASHGKSVYAVGLQLDFIWFELTTFSGYGLSALKKSTTISAATLAFMTDFEACGTCLSTKRISYAQTAYNAYKNDVVADAGVDAAKHDAGDASTHADSGSSGSSGSSHGGEGDASSPGEPGTPTEDAGTGEPGTSHEEPSSGSSTDQGGGCAVGRVDARRELGSSWLALVAAAAASVIARRRPRRPAPRG